MVGMDEIEAQWESGRAAMRDAFVELLAHVRTETVEDWEAVSAIQHRFWDGHVEVKDSWTVMRFRLWLARYSV